MNYDWEKIFKNKSNRELYDIFIGKKILSKKAVEIAKSELERRKFDFSKVKDYHDVWELGSIISEEEFSEFNDRTTYVSLRNYLFVVIGITLISFLLNKYTNTKISTEFILILIGYSTFAVLLENYTYRRKKRARNNRINRIKELKRNLDNEGLLDKNNPLYEELLRLRKENKESLDVWMKIFIVVSLIALIIVIIKLLFVS